MDTFSRQRRKNSETHKETADRRSTDRQRRQCRRSAQTDEQVDARPRWVADRGRSQYRRAQTPISFEAALMDIDSTSSVERLCETCIVHNCGTFTDKCERC